MPLEGYAKIHVDAGVMAGRGGPAGAVCRDRAGNYLGSSALVIDVLLDPATLEAISCREALAPAEDLHLQNIVIASDCKQVISYISKGARGRHGASEINLKATLFHCNFSFEVHAVNCEAHSLDRFSLSQGPGRHVWFGQPHETCQKHKN